MPEQTFQPGHAIDVETALNGSETGQHLLLGEFVLPVETDPTGETRGVTDGRAVVWIDTDGTLRLSIFSREQEAWTTVGAHVQAQLEDLLAQLQMQPETTDIKDVLVNTGLLEDGGATPLDLDGGQATVGNFLHEGTQIAFFGGALTNKEAVTGSRSTQTAGVLADLINALEGYGLITDGTTP